MSGTADVVNHLSSLVERTSVDVPEGVNDPLIPYITRAIGNLRPANKSQVILAGQIWIILGQAIIESFVPDVPLDPTVEQSCQTKLNSSLRSRLNAELRSYVVAEKRITGNEKTVVIDSIRTELQDIDDEVDASRVWDYDARNDKLTAFYQEVHRFLANVMRAQKIDGLANDLATKGSRTEIALAEEENFQAAAHAFVKRLEESYGILDDLVQPICTAVQAIRLGLRLMAQEAIQHQAASKAERQVALVKQLTSFPSVSALEALAADRHDHQPSRETAGELLLQLRSINMLVNAGHSIPAIADDLNTLYGRISALWRIDQEAIKRQQQVTESLYRQRTTEEDVESDEVVEERELAQLFPTYEGDQSPPETPDSTGPKSTFVKDAHVLGVYRSHLALFRLPNADAEKRAWSADRKLVVSRLLSEHRSAFDQDLDRTSRAYQLLALSSESQNGAAVDADLQYNFYMSPNRPEITRALHILRRLRSRLTVILEEWPDQIRLQHIIDRCDYTQSMPAVSPVARMLAAMEQLLDVVQDWETYANRDNSLATFRDEIIALIIGWRKLELSAWNRLLDQEVVLYDAENSAWWFRLYELLIVGTESVIESFSETEVADKLKQHVVAALPLVMELISATSCGHFGSRLRLLGSFADLIVATKMQISSSSSAKLWQSVVHLLRNIEASYGQYVEIVQQNIADRRAPLEKAVRDFIKLASWKDINVNAMQASARKSHAQLYKTVRKFREVLRQPVSSFLSVPLPQLPTLQSNTAGETMSFSTSVLPERPSDVPTPSFLIDANRTTQKYQRIMASEDQLCSSASELLEDLAVDVVETTEALAKETPGNLTEENTKNVKNLQLRKRKAFADLLKELRRLGFSAKVRADQLASQCSAADILRLCPIESQTGVNGVAQELLQRVELYHHRLDFALPAMRHAMNDHSPDIVTHDLQRAHGFAESVFAEALGSRKK